MWHSAKRLSYGPTPALVTQIAQAGVTAWIDSQLNHTSIDDTAATTAAAAFQYAHGTAAEVAAGGEPWRVPTDMAAATTVRAIMSQRQLFERTVSFWWDALNVDAKNSSVDTHCPSYDADVIRAHTFGRFSDMLVASAQSGAMLTYLDNVSSRADGGHVPNENYARELMELHTVGVDGGYTEADVTAVAHLLSGWSLTHAKNGTFTFRSSRHNLGPFTSPTHTVLGWSRGPLTGVAAGEAFLRHLARHPATARRVAHRLAVRFIGEHIGAGDPVVDAAVDAYNANDTAIRPTLRVLLTSPEFAAAADRRVRRPTELLAASARAMGVPPFDTNRTHDLKWNIEWIAGPLGGLPHQWAPPNGYPDRDAYWVSVGALIGRWNLVTHMSNEGLPGFAVDKARLGEWTTGSTTGEWLTAAAQRFGVPLDAPSRARLLAGVSRSENSPITLPTDRWVAARLTALLMQSPQFQTL